MPYKHKSNQPSQQRYQQRQKILPVLLAVIGAVIMLNLLGTVSLLIKPLTIDLAVDVTYPGSTVLRIPPIGSIRAITHHYVPVQLTLTLTNIDLDSLRQIAFADDVDTTVALTGFFRQYLTKAVVQVLLQLSGICGLGGLIGIYVGGRRRWYELLGGFLLGCVFALVVFTGTYYSYDINAFAKPTYQGIIQAAPWMINLIQEGLVKVDELGEQIQKLAANLYAVFNQIENLKDIGVLAADLLVLHVSDIHNHPVAFDFIDQVVSNFPIDFIIDTGDLTDWGTPLEAEIVKRIEQLGLTYVFISGNHDAPDVLTKLEQTDNVVILSSEPQWIHGISIAGWADPSAENYSPQNASLAELSQIAAEINQFYWQHPQPPLIFAVHNYRIAAQLEPGLFPVVLCGHNHVQSVQQVGDTVYINAGTTGAAGIRGLQTTETSPFSLAILYFAQNPDTAEYHLIAVDSIQVEGLRSSFSLDRVFINQSGRNQPDNVETITEALG